MMAAAAQKRKVRASERASERQRWGENKNVVFLLCGIFVVKCR